jgi:flagellar biosynthesis protein FlhF
MSLKKFISSTGRLAMLEARQSLGEDAVIISTRKTEQGVEVVAARADDLSEIAEAHIPMLRRVRHSASAGPEINANGISNQRATESQSVSFLQFIQERPELTPTLTAATAKHKKIPPTFEHTVSSRSTPVMPAADTKMPADMVHELRHELASLKSWMTGHFDAMSYHESMQRRPVAAAIQKDLLIAGFSPKLARELTRKLSGNVDETQARAWTVAVLEKNLLTISVEQDIIDTGGIYALVGPTGVGKTTTIAKLASRCAVKYGRDSVGLITIDCYRIGAQDQLRIYGKILGISVHTAQDRDSLLSVLRSLSGKRLVLIDTIGLGQRDERVSELLATVGSSAIKRLLVLNCAAQAETLEEVLGRYRGSDQTQTLAGVILSKTDEATRPGAALDVAIRHRLPIFYETNGQRVPEDIAIANANSLMLRAVKHQPAPPFQVASHEVCLTFLEPPISLTGTSRDV